MQGILQIKMAEISPSTERKEPSVMCNLISAFENENNDIRVLKEFAILKSVLSDDECSQMIRSIERMGMKPLQSQYPLRKTKRIVIDSTELADSVWKRVEPHIPIKEMRDEYGDIWRICGLNDRFRFCSYGKGDHFKAHCDGFWQSSYRCRSFATLMIYLNNVDDHIGGSTRFLDYGLYVRPRAGNAVFFLTDDLLHDGEEIRNVDDSVFKAEKYIMRTDVMYECKKFKNSELRKKIYDMRQEAFRCEDKGKDAKAIKLWEKIIEMENHLKEQVSVPRSPEGGIQETSQEPCALSLNDEDNTTIPI